MDRLVVTLPADTDVRLGQETTVHIDGGEPVPATVIATELIDGGRSAKVTVGMDRMPTISSYSRLSVGLEAEPSR